jgi:HAD superfamily hydrolase (TIGR01509 family)
VKTATGGIIRDSTAKEYRVTSRLVAAKRPPIQAIIFDLDGLLVDSETVSGEAMRSFLREYGHEMRPGTLEGALGRRMPEAIALLADSYRLHMPLDDLVAAFDQTRLNALRGNIVAMPGAVSLLNWVRAAGLRVALATSSFRRHADVSLEEAGLQGRFDVEVTGDEVRHGKPEPDLFLLAATRLGVKPESCLVFEDAPAGLEAAARAGMRRAWVPNDHTRGLSLHVEVDVILQSLTDAVAWLEGEGIAAGRTSEPSSSVP